MAKVKVGEHGPRYVAIKRTKGTKSVPGGRRPKKPSRGQGKP